MMPGIVVFLGPSLDRESAECLLRAAFYPPAKRGDIAAAAAGGARIITLIDGVFFQDDAVGHREILDAIREGVRVIGASSMGALRAAELEVLGMEGVGEIFCLYRDGILISDDEVALIYDPETFLPLSEPLINIRCTLRKAEEAGALDQETVKILKKIAQSLYFPDRTWDVILSRAEGDLSRNEWERIPAVLSRFKVDRKREDAVLALERTQELARELGIVV
jgi:hypothetical protein